MQHVASLFLLACGLAQKVEQLPERAMQAALAIRQAVAAAQDRWARRPSPRCARASTWGHCW